MAEPQIVDPFVSTEPEVEVDEETHRILQERIKAADAGEFVSAEVARQRIHQWLSNSSTSKTH